MSRCRQQQPLLCLTLTYTFGSPPLSLLSCRRTDLVLTCLSRYGVTTHGLSIVTNSRILLHLHSIKFNENRFVVRLLHVDEQAW